MNIPTVDDELYARSIHFLLKVITTHKMVYHAVWWTRLHRSWCEGDHSRLGIELMSEERFSSSQTLRIVSLSLILGINRCIPKNSGADPEVYHLRLILGNDLYFRFQNCWYTRGPRHEYRQEPRNTARLRFVDHVVSMFVHRYLVRNDSPVMDERGAEQGPLHWYYGQSENVTILPTSFDA